MITFRYKLAAPSHLSYFRDEAAYQKARKGGEVPRNPRFFKDRAIWEAHDREYAEATKGLNAVHKAREAAPGFEAIQAMRRPGSPMGSTARLGSPATIPRFSPQLESGMRRLGRTLRRV